MTGYSSESDIIQNLKDAGCGADTISEFVEDMRQGDFEGNIGHYGGEVLF